jgi:putative hemolysin
MVKLNKQSSMVLVAVVFATAMIVGSIVASTSDNMAFATHKKVTKQVKSQSNANAQSTNCAANGGAATGTGSGLLAGIGFANSTNTGINACFNTNTNNNVDTGNQAATTS